MAKWSWLPKPNISIPALRAQVLKLVGKDIFGIKRDAAHWKKLKELRQAAIKEHGLRETTGQAIGKRELAEAIDKITPGGGVQSTERLDRMLDPFLPGLPSRGDKLERLLGGSRLGPEQTRGKYRITDPNLHRIMNQEKKLMDTMSPAELLEQLEKTVAWMTDTQMGKFPRLKKSPFDTAEGDRIRRLTGFLPDSPFSKYITPGRNVKRAYFKPMGRDLKTFLSKQRTPSIPAGISKRGAIAAATSPLLLALTGGEAGGTQVRSPLRNAIMTAGSLVNKISPLNVAANMAKNLVQEEIEDVRSRRQRLANISSTSGASGPRIARGAAAIAARESPMSKVVKEQKGLSEHGMVVPFGHEISQGTYKFGQHIGKDLGGIIERFILNRKKKKNANGGR